eukprot:309933_1
MGNNNCCGCKENPNRKKEILMKQKKVNTKQKPKQTNITQENKHIVDMYNELKAHERNDNEDKMSKLDLSEIKTEISECKSMKQVNIKKKIKQANLGHQNT